MMSAQMAKRPMYASLQQVPVAATLRRASSSSLSPLGVSAGAAVDREVGRRAVLQQRRR
jgi:hypothetical protein